MPIATKELRRTAQQANGHWRVWEEHTDTLGRVWPFKYMVPLLADAVTMMEERSFPDALVDRDVAEVVSWVQDRNTVDSFDYTNRDIDVLKAEEEIALHFARSVGEVAILSAWWLEDLNPPQWNTLATRLGWDTSTGEIGDRVQTRAINLVVAEPDFFRTENV